MKIKKYTGNSTQEAMSKLKSELGLDAIILNTRTVKQKGILGFLKKPLIEITAAYESEKKHTFRKSNDQNLLKINNELINLRNTIEQISANSVNKDLKVHPKLNEYLVGLVNNGADESIVISILNKLSQQINLDIKDSGSIRNIVKQILFEYIGEPEPLNIDNSNQKIIFFMGPTGVGKTTTLAKIAAQLVMKKEYNIGLVTSDTYRIAAVEQLKVYSEILQIPLEVIYTEEDMYKTLVTFKEKDVIFVDTTGKSHRDVDKGDDIFSIVDSIKNKEVYLVLSGTTDYSTLKSIIEQYSFIDNYKIIFTKLDETERLGNILNIRYLTNKPISYITTGQNVPDDIEIMNKEKIVNCLIGEIKHERPSR